MVQQIGDAHSLAHQYGAAFYLAHVDAQSSAGRFVGCNTRIKHFGIFSGKQDSPGDDGGGERPPPSWAAGRRQPKWVFGVTVTFAFGPICSPIGFASSRNAPVESSRSPYGTFCGSDIDATSDAATAWAGSIR